jgi:phosphohistidine phosphatase SixA
MPTRDDSRAVNRRGFMAVCAAALGAASIDLRAVVDRPSSSPAEILIIRHAEKTETGHDLHLNARGRMRAEALPHLYEGRFAKPDMIICARQSRYSNHAYETIEPLAHALGLSIDNRWANGKDRALAKALLSDARYRGKHVLICWHHESIPQLASALGATTAPRRWRDKVYDSIWRLTYADQRVTFEDLPQQLLPGDRSRG